MATRASSPASFRSAPTSLALIRQLGRPGIVTLRGEGGSAFALLTGLDARNATLRMGSTARTVPLATLADLWRGDFATLWRTPPGYERRVAEGDIAPLADWLGTQLAVWRGEPAPTGGDPALKAHIHAFQVSQGLDADGVAGPLTFMQLNRATGVDEPRLQTTEK